MTGAGLVAVAAAAVLGLQEPPARPQEPPSRLDDVVVDERLDLEAQAATFVRSVAPPIHGRGLALWGQPVCVGVGAMRADAAQALADRVSDWAHSLGLQVEGAGCTPNIFIMATDDGDRAAAELVASRPREFRTGASASDRGAAALREFQTSGRPVRWWHVSLPVNPETGLMAGRLPGSQPLDLMFSFMKKPSDFSTATMTVEGSRLTRATRDELQQVVVVIDDEALARADFAQLSDYVALVALAQVDPAGDTRGVDTILNLFDPAADPPHTLTAWDQGFLRGLYGAEQNQPGTVGNVLAVARAMARDLATPEPADDR